MTITVADLLRCLDEIAPFGMAESWDNVGLLVGDRGRDVSSLLIGLDPTNRLLDEAIAIGADTVVTHHPAIFKPIPAIDTAEPAGRFLEKALNHRLTVCACHTNFDSTLPGVNDALADLLGLQETAPLVPAAGQTVEGAGLGRIGRYPGGKPRQQFLAGLLDALGLASVQLAGQLPDTISCVALCGGSGSEFAELARARGADVYVSAEIKHNVARWAEEARFCIIDGSHYATEKPAVRLLARRLAEHAATRHWQLAIHESTTETHPFKTVDRYSYSQH